MKCLGMPNWGGTYTIEKAYKVIHIQEWKTVRSIKPGRSCFASKHGERIRG